MELSVHVNDVVEDSLFSHVGGFSMKVLESLDASAD
jgi:hypothetical protein